jgi:hypothetical protein
MPSGFQQDQNQLSPAYFRVVIDMNNGGDAWYTQADNDGATTTGRITTWAWDNAETASDLPQTQVIANALARGNMRFQAIVDMLGMFADCQILDIENSGNSDAASQVDQSSIAFTVKYDRNEFLLPAFVSYAKANTANLYDYGTDGTVELDGVTYIRYYSASGQEFSIADEEDVIKELVYLGASRNNDYTKSVRVFAPIEGEDPMVGSGLQQEIEINRPASTNGYVFDNITVTTIDGTTTTQSFD